MLHRRCDGNHFALDEFPDRLRDELLVLIQNHKELP
jgi:hypothetical protein